MSGQGPGIEALDRHHLRLGEVLVNRLLGSPITGQPAGFHDDKPFGPDPSRLLVFMGHSIVSDVRTGHRDNLSLVGRVRQYLLIPAHGGIEDHFPDGLSFISQRPPFKDGSVSKSQECLLHSNLLIPVQCPTFTAMRPRPSAKLMTYK